MNRTLCVAIGVSLSILSVILQVGCGGGSGYGSTPTAPSSGGTSGGGSGAAANTTISIVGNAGSQAFSPNPITVAVNQRVVFRNDDSRTHRIVADAGGFDSGSVAPGASSAPLTITSSSPMPFHCTIHPSMVGAINTPSSSGGGSGDPEPSPGY